MWALWARWAWLDPFGTSMHVVASGRLPPMMVEVVPSRMTAVLLDLCASCAFCLHLAGLLMVAPGRQRWWRVLCWWAPSLVVVRLRPYRLMCNRLLEGCGWFFLGEALVGSSDTNVVLLARDSFPL
jgi:hypothetical protein